MTPQEKRVMDNLVVAVEYLLRKVELEAQRNGIHPSEVTAIRETLRDADADLKNSSIVKPGNVSKKWNCFHCEFATDLYDEMTMHVRSHF